MIKRVIFGVLIVFSAVFAFAQDNPDTVTQQGPPNCDTVAFDATRLIMYFYANKQYDSANIVLDNWQAACGLSEPILRTRILFAIQNHSFTETLYDSTIVDDVLNYLMRMDTTDSPDLYSSYKAYFGNVPLRGDYDYFTQSVADELLETTFYDPSELLFSELYANVLPDPVKTIVKDTTFTTTQLQLYYNQRVDKYLKMPDWHVGIYAGLWIPFDYAACLGNHPMIGMQLGMRTKQMTFNVSLNFKFGKPKNEYTYMQNGYSDTTNSFVGGYFGIDAERKILSFGKNEVSILAGLGYDGFDAVNVNTEDSDPNNDVSYMIGSLNTNFGLGFRHFTNNGTYYGLKAIYNIVNYNNPGGTYLSGNTVSISLTLGVFYNQKKAYYLKEYRYSE
jgi:hypothetical protein